MSRTVNNLQNLLEKIFLCISRNHRSCFKESTQHIENMPTRTTSESRAPLHDVRRRKCGRDWRQSATAGPVTRCGESDLYLWRINTSTSILESLSVCLPADPDRFWKTTRQTDSSMGRIFARRCQHLRNRGSCCQCGLVFEDCKNVRRPWVRRDVRSH